jgi:hypothetical protein
LRQRREESKASKREPKKFQFQAAHQRRVDHVAPRGVARVVKRCQFVPMKSILAVDECVEENQGKRQKDENAEITRHGA